jgi:hypothetical protein
MKPILLQLETGKENPKFPDLGTTLPVSCDWDIMSHMDATSLSPANELCKSCGLCCTGHLFTWTKLRSAELDAAEGLGLNVIRTVPRQRGFDQPCPLWRGECTVYDSPHYPHFCRTYKCKLLKKLLDGATSPHDALRMVSRTKESIREVEELLPDSSIPRFRERLVSFLEKPAAEENPELQRKAHALLRVYDEVFGVNDLIDLPAED